LTAVGLSREAPTGRSDHPSWAAYHRSLFNRGTRASVMPALIITVEVAQGRRNLARRGGRSRGRRAQVDTARGRMRPWRSTNACAGKWWRELVSAAHHGYRYAPCCRQPPEVRQRAISSRHGLRSAGDGSLRPPSAAHPAQVASTARLRALARLCVCDTRLEGLAPHFQDVAAGRRPLIQKEHAVL
jgi:hypothetical protein